MYILLCVIFVLDQIRGAYHCSITL